MPNNGQQPACDTLLAKMAQLFDMPETATESDVILRVAQLLIAPQAATAAQAEPDPAKFMPVAAVEEMLAARGVELAAAREERIVRKVDAAMEAGTFNLPLKDWALALARSDEAAFDTFVQKTGTPFAYLKQEYGYMNGPPPRVGKSIGGSELATSVCAQLGLSPDALND
jgi:hypothetical protein